MHSLFICLISISDFFFLVMKMSHKRKILLFKSCLLVTHQPFFVFYTYIFLIHKIHHKISTARNPDKHQPVVCEQDNWTHLWGTAVPWHSPSSHSSSVWSSLWWPSPWPPMPGTAGPSWCPAMPSLRWQHSSPHFPAGPCCSSSFRPGRITTEGQRGGKRGNRSSFGTPSHSCGQGCVSRLPHTCPCPHGREQPLRARGELLHLPLPGTRGPVSPGCRHQLHSSCLLLHYSEFSKHRKLSWAVSGHWVAALLPGPWKKECLLLHFTCTRNRTHFTTLANCNFTGLVAFLFLICAGSQGSVQIITLHTEQSASVNGRTAYIC